MHFHKPRYGSLKFAFHTNYMLKIFRYNLMYYTDILYIGHLGAVITLHYTKNQKFWLCGYGRLDFPFLLKNCEIDRSQRILLMFSYVHLIIVSNNRYVKK